MAKIVPQGSVVNMGITDPMDRLNQVLETVSRFQNLAANQQVARAKRETAQVNSLGLINGLIDKANDGEDLEYAENVLNSLDTNYFSNPDTEILHDLTNKNLTDAKFSFESVTNSGNEIANLMTSNFSVFDKDTDAPMAEKKLADMNANELISYTQQIAGNEGALGAVTKLKNRINAFEQQYSTLFGINDKNIATKKPNIKFKDANGNDVDPTEFGILFNNYKNRIDILIESYFRDGILNYDEAKAIVGGDTTAYRALRQERDQAFKFLAQQGVTTLRGIDSKIATLAKEDDEQYGMSLQSMFAGDTKMVDEYFNHIASINPGNVFEITSDPEQNAANASAHALRSTKEENLIWFNQYREAHAKDWLKHKEQAVSWGFGYFGMDDATPANLFGEPKAKSDTEGKSDAEKARLAEETRLSEEAKKAEETRLAEEDRLAEETRLAEEAEKSKKAEEAKATEKETARKEKLREIKAPRNKVGLNLYNKYVNKFKHLLSKQNSKLTKTNQEYNAKTKQLAAEEKKPITRMGENKEKINELKNELNKLKDKLDSLKSGVNTTKNHIDNEIDFDTWYNTIATKEDKKSIDKSIIKTRAERATESEFGTSWPYISKEEKELFIDELRP